MRIWSRNCYWSPRKVKTFLLNIPELTCKTCLRLTGKLWDCSILRYGCILVLLCALCSWLFVWAFVRDPCFQWAIQQSLCEEYRQGLIAGVLCYDMCIEHSFSLTGCVSEQNRIMVFSKYGLLYKVSKERATTEPAVKDGITHEELWDLLEGLFTRTLGAGDHNTLIQKTMDYVDFNGDDVISFAEVNSLWQLLQIREFQTLFVFQGNSVFPVINSTCGRLYAYEKPHHNVLYDLSSRSFLDHFFKHRYRWFFPEWPQRVHIALGLLEYASLAMEEANAKFYMCDFKPTNFGYTEYFEMKVTNIENIYPEALLMSILRNKKCISNSDCLVGKFCRSKCDRLSRRCTRSILTIDLVKICEVISDYVLYDSPPEVKFDLGRLISKCSKLPLMINYKSTSMLHLKQNLIMDEMTQILWDLLKDEPNKWLYKPTHLRL